MTKNTSYHYSIIIPHKNTPRLLERCLCSIPTWDEIQIIIIDDNSNSESVDFSHFPGNGRKNTEVLFTKEGKGAGYARNIGLSHARGKWIIFADADDFFTANCFTILNEYMDSPHKVIYFNVRFVMSDDPSQESRRGTYYTNFFNDVNPENKLRYQSQVPWGKMIRRSFLSTFHIQCDSMIFFALQSNLQIKSALKLVFPDMISGLMSLISFFNFCSNLWFKVHPTFNCSRSGCWYCK